MLERGHSNACGTRPLILKARPGVTTILRGILRGFASCFEIITDPGTKGIGKGGSQRTKER
jgi:hypothetical protein